MGKCFPGGWSMTQVTHRQVERSGYGAIASVAGLDASVRARSAGIRAMQEPVKYAVDNGHFTAVDMHPSREMACAVPGTSRWRVA